MAKKRAREADGASEAPDKMVEDSDSSDDEDFDIVNVDFEWFNFNEKIDFLGTKNLIRQLFDVDATLFDVSALADLILSQSSIGSTVKTDGEESDPFAFVTALNVQEHRQKKPMAQLISYLSERAKGVESLAHIIPELLASGQHVGLVLSERLINMPADIAPPLYTMLIEEIQDAVDDKEPYEFTHYLIVSKTYHEIESTLVEERKKKKGKQDATLYYFHPEDEVLQKHAVAHGSYPFTKTDDAVADSKRAFQEMGVMPMGSMILIEASKFSDAVKAVGEYLSPPV
ncbi:hypothetical protein CIB48_g8954 [Xylaria polymorpha]|nr:hypothetical protein CIB48_g8954 [Xylaria polymorpha]